VNKSILSLNATIHKDINLTLIQREYLMWGGVPRYVLEGALMKGIQDQLASAITTCDESIFGYIGESAVKDDISHKIIQTYLWLK
jgi:hypothetical protein